MLWFPGDGTIDATVENNGTIKAEGAGSTVNFERKVVGTGTDDISGGATLEFVKGAKQTYDFGAGGGTLDLLDPTNIGGKIDNFATGDTIKLAGDWTFSSLTHPTSGTTALTLGSSGVDHTFHFAGNFTESDFNIVSGSTTSITWK